MGYSTKYTTPFQLVNIDANKSRYFNYYKKDYIKKDYLYKARSPLYVISTRRLAVINNVNLSNIDDYDRSSLSISDLEN